MPVVYNIYYGRYSKMYAQSDTSIIFKNPSNCVKRVMAGCFVIPLKKY